MQDTPSPKPAILARSLLQQGVSYRIIASTTGLSKATISYHAKQLGLGKERKSPKTKPQTIKIGRIDAAEAIRRHIGKKGARTFIRTKILEENLLPYECALCEINEWRGQPISLRLDHINGDGRDHRLENLRFVCPNCDSQQPTHGHRNRGRYKNNGVCQ